MRIICVLSQDLVTKESLKTLATSDASTDLWLQWTLYRLALAILVPQPEGCGKRRTNQQNHKSFKWYCTFDRTGLIKDSDPIGYVESDLVSETAISFGVPYQQCCEYLLHGRCICLWADPIDPVPSYAVSWFTMLSLWSYDHPKLRMNSDTSTHSLLWVNILA